MSSEESECDDLLGRQSEAEQPAGRGSLLAFPHVLAEGFREQPGELPGQAPGGLHPLCFQTPNQSLIALDYPFSSQHLIGKL